MIDENGNITLDRAADEYMPLEWYPDGETALDISAANITFHVQDCFSLTPLRNSSDGKGRILHFTPEHATALGTTLWEYLMLLDTAGQKTTLRRGYISATGWAP